MYTAGGNESLIDGIEGTENWAAGEWQSYHGKNFEAVVSFKKETTLNKINLTFLQDIKSWIWAPRNVKIFTSIDNITFTELETFNTILDEKAEGSQIFKVSISLPKTTTKFVKIIAANFPQIPSWHVGAGDKAHIFISEISFK